MDTQLTEKILRSRGFKCVDMWELAYRNGDEVVYCHPELKMVQRFLSEMKEGKGEHPYVCEASQLDKDLHIRLSIDQYFRINGVTVKVSMLFADYLDLERKEQEALAARSQEMSTNT